MFELCSWPTLAEVHNAMARHVPVMNDHVQALRIMLEVIVSGQVTSLHMQCILYVGGTKTLCLQAAIQSDMPQSKRMARMVMRQPTTSTLLCAAVQMAGCCGGMRFRHSCNSTHTSHPAIVLT